jgi:hypothetical protein
MKELKIEIPKGYEIDKDKSTFEKIVFKKVKKELPESWEGLGEISGYFVDKESHEAEYIKNATNVYWNKKVFKTKEQAEASIALAQLSQLMEVYRNGWVPNWSDDTHFKYCIEFYHNTMNKAEYIGNATFLSFQDAETRNLFFNNFMNLIEKAKPLLS